MSITVDVAVEWMLPDGEIRRCGVVVLVTVLVDAGKIVFPALVAVVRTISGGGIRRLSPGVFWVIIVISGWIGTGVSTGFGYNVSEYIKGWCGVLGLVHDR